MCCCCLHKEKLLHFFAREIISLSLGDAIFCFLLFEGVKSASGNFCEQLFICLMLYWKMEEDLILWHNFHSITLRAQRITAHRCFLLNLISLLYFWQWHIQGNPFHLCMFFLEKKEKCIKRLGIECAVYLLLTTAVFCDSSFHDRAKQQNTLCLNLIFSKSKIWNILLILQNLLKCKNKF